MDELIEISRKSAEEEKKSVGRIVFNVIFWSVFTFFAAYFIFDTFLPNKTVYIFGIKGYTVESESMVGIYNKNDVVFVNAPDYDKLQVGDIITYETYTVTRSDSGLNYSIITSDIVNTHYLAEIGTDVNGVIYYRTMCYENFHKDSTTWSNSDYDKYYNKKGEEVLLRREDILGKAAFSVPWVGNINSVFQVVFGDRIFVLLLFSDVIIFYLLFSMLWSDYRNYRSDKSALAKKNEKKAIDQIEYKNDRKQ
ncbi:MAG: hypothetical protein WC366_02200 [Bacilli bacterium]|jgi:signal peptidase I